MTMSSSQTYNAGDVLTADSLTKHVTEATPTVLTAAVDGNSQDITAIDEVGLVDSAANATSAGRVRRNGANATWHDGTAAGRLFYAGGTDVPVADGGTGISSGTSGGVLAFTGATTLASSAALTSNGVVLGGGAGAAPSSTAAGTANQVLRVPGAGGTPAFGQVNIASTDAVTGTLAVASGGTGLTAGTSGGVLGYTAAGTLASSAALTANQLVLGGGAGVTPSALGSLGTTTTVLHGNAAGAPTFAAVNVANDVTGVLDETNGGTGQSTITQGDLLYGSASNVLSKLAAGTSGYFLKTLGAGANPAWAAIAAGLSWAGGQTTQGQSTSTTEVDLLTVTLTTSIPVNVPFIIICPVRKGSGAAAAAHIGLKLNTTVVEDASAVFSATNQVETGIIFWVINQANNWERPGVKFFATSPGATAGEEGLTADLPNATITSVVIRGFVDSGSIDITADEVHVYQFATSG